MKYILTVWLLVLPLQAQNVQQIEINANNLPAQARHLLRPLNVGRAKLGVVLRAIGQQSRLNLSIQDGLDMIVDEVVNDIPAIDAVVQLCLNNGLRLKQQGSTFRIERMPNIVAAPQPERIPEITYQDGRMSWRLNGESIEAVARRITELTGTNVGVMQGVQVPMRGFAVNMVFEDALRAIAQTNGLRVQNQAGFYTFMSNQEGGRGNPQPTNWDTPQEARGSNKITKLIRLKSAHAEPIAELMPATLKGSTEVQLVKELNGFILFGTSEEIERIEAFIAALDVPAPQILIEAIAVDFRISNVDTRGLSFGRGAANDSSALNRNFWNFGIPTSNGDGTVVQGTGGELRRIADIWREFLGISVGGTLGQLVQTIGRLPNDFYIRLQYLTQSGNAEIRSRPQISTLNGHSASISIGETQYFLLNTANYSPYSTNQTTPTGNTNNANQQLNPYSNTQRFEQIEAKVSLTITPWVTASGEITAEIKPEFSTPVGKFDPKVPPTISSRVLESTVRLRDGETIILGGLITEVEDISENKVPFFHKIPLIGRLFKSKKVEKTKQELIIFVTPHVFYGDERDHEKWQTLQSQYQVKPTTTPQQTPVQPILPAPLPTPPTE